MGQNEEHTHVDRGQAQSAYSALDVDASARAHASRVEGGHDEDHSKVGGQLKTIIFGGLDGILTSFAIVSSCAGSGLTSRVVLLLGACNILADAMAMGVGEYLSTKSSDEFARRERAREDWELRNHPEGEVEEMVEIYVQRGMSAEDARTVITTMAKYHDFFVDVMMVEELGLFVPEANASLEAAKDGLLMFAAFVVFGTAPLFGYLLTPLVITQPTEHQLFLAACAVTAVTLFALGAAKSRFVQQSAWRLGVETLALGALCASVAYFCGVALSSQMHP
jgi:DNA damage-binding protein 1